MRGTTPTITMEFAGVDLTGFIFYVTISQKNGRIKLTLSDDDVEFEYSNNKSIVSVALTQEDTLMFDAKEKTAKVQMRGINSSGIAIKSAIKEIEVDEVLFGGVIEYNGDIIK